jgi:hypothetical protein
MWIVMTSSAKPVGRFGTYRNVALVELDQEYTARYLTLLQPRCISERAKGVLRVRHLGKFNVGKTANCAYWRAVDAAEASAQAANNAGDAATAELLINPCCA